MTDLIQIDYLTGTIMLPKLRWNLLETRIKRRYWFGYRREWYIESDFIRLGPFDDITEANEILVMTSVA